MKDWKFKWIGLMLVLAAAVALGAMSAGEVKAPPYPNDEQFIDELSTTTAVALTVPDNTEACTIQAQGGIVYLTQSGTDPTTTQAFQIAASETFYYDADPAVVELIAGAAGTDVFILYYR